jgi:mannose-1-phosphate guanylyltransferase
MNYAVIMAGGGGTRFWPKSRKSRPKQFLSLFGNETMLQKTIGRLNGFIDPEQVLVITNEAYLQIVAEQAPDLEEDHVIGEKVGRNTAPCIAAAASLLYKKDPEAVMIVLPADHEIGKPDEFVQTLKRAVSAAEEYNSLVTIGIQPDRPETGYGYIQRGNKPLKEEERTVFPVVKFEEKPNLERAEQFLKSGDYLWNGGIFIWKVSVIVDSFKKHMPEIHTLMMDLIDSDATGDQIDAFYRACPSISVDYGIMEKAENVQVVPGSFEWNDVGSWKAVHELSAKDENQNAKSGSNALFHNTTNSLIHSESKKLITLVGVDNLAVVETEDSIMVINLDKAQEVKEVYELIKNDEEKKDYL